MDFHRAQADAKIGGNVLAWMASDDKIQDLTLPSGQTSNAVFRGAAKLEVGVQIIWQIERSLHARPHRSEDTPGRSDDNTPATFL
jgi:hypothetical protein